MNRDEMGALYARVRAATVGLAEPLDAEDCLVQSMPDVSPTKWHLAHTTWFFETFVLERAVPGYVSPDQRYEYLFNSYYHGVGPQHPRAERGRVSRPTLAQVLAYRAHVDGWMHRLIGDASDKRWADYAFVIELGLNHEEQHQELVLTDIKHVLCTQPLCPAYRARPADLPNDGAPPLGWTEHAGGNVEVGVGNSGFCFDNERPRHRVWLEPFQLADRLVTNGEWLEFMTDRGYERSELWLSDGWDARRREGWSAPLYWLERGDGKWEIATLGGGQELALAEPVCHVSHYEADAFARWAGARLPLEAEWELVASEHPVEGNFVESGRLHPRAGSGQWFGDVWEWTSSPYVAYPGYRAFEGALGEYNEKFMANQLVLRGGSCVSARRHLRAEYRNFFPPHARWQFSGLRLARWLNR